HAVTAYRLEFILGPVGIAENDGFSNSEGEWADGSRDEDAVLVYYAGHAAARRFDPTLPADPDLCGATDDYESASTLLPTLMGEGESPEEAQVRLEQAAAAFVEEHWEPICAVAEMLIADSRLHEDEVSAIVEAFSDGVDWRDELETCRNKLRAMIGPKWV
ncbi:MAG: hypothetical protein ACKOCT_01595, partial [Alphaproteobacteria bacterium]